MEAAGACRACVCSRSWWRIGWNVAGPRPLLSARSDLRRIFSSSLLFYSGGLNLRQAVPMIVEAHLAPEMAKSAMPFLSPCAAVGLRSISVGHFLCIKQRRELLNLWNAALLSCRYPLASGGDMLSSRVRHPARLQRPGGPTASGDVSANGTSIARYESHKVASTCTVFGGKLAEPAFSARSP